MLTSEPLFFPLLLTPAMDLSLHSLKKAGKQHCSVYKAVKRDWPHLKRPVLPRQYPTLSGSQTTSRRPGMRQGSPCGRASNHQIRRLIKQGILAADQVVPDAPYQIRANDLLDERVTTAIARKGRPCRPYSQKQTSRFRYLKMRCTMNSPLQRRAGTFRCDCCLCPSRRRPCNGSAPPSS